MILWPFCVIFCLLRLFCNIFSIMLCSLHVRSLISYCYRELNQFRARWTLMVLSLANFLTEWTNSRRTWKLLSCTILLKYSLPSTSFNNFLKTIETVQQYENRLASKKSYYLWLPGLWDQLWKIWYPFQ